MTNHEFLNRIRSLYCLEHDQVPELTDAQWKAFEMNPANYLIRTDDFKAAAIMREVEKRQLGAGMKPTGFSLDLEGEDARLTVGYSSLLIPCTLAGDIADAFNQLWLDWHSADIIERESESEPQVDRPFYKDEIPF